MTHASRSIFSGVVFSVLWASASVASKFGLLSSEPLTLFTIRFLLAGGILLLFSLFLADKRLPVGKEWLQLTVFGAFNTTLYLGIFIVSLHQVSAGITALSIALNPLLISILSALWLKRPIAAREWLSIGMGITGVVIASYPLVQTGYATYLGLGLLALSMLTYSIGSVYYSSIKWQLSRTLISGWQVMIGGLLLLPFTLLFEGGGTNYDLRFWITEIWLVIPVSIAAVQLWLYLLKEDSVRAALWLFLCPIFGLLLSAWLLDEPLTYYTLVGTILVLASLYLGQQPLQARGPRVNKVSSGRH